MLFVNKTISGAPNASILIVLCAGGVQGLLLYVLPDAGRLVDRNAVSALQNTLLDCLQKYSSSRYPDSAHRYAKILLRLPSLRIISHKAAQKFLSFSLEGDVKMNALVLEMMN